MNLTEELSPHSTAKNEKQMLHNAGTAPQTSLRKHEKLDFILLHVSWNSTIKFKNQQ